MADIFEAAMILSFGISWPINIRKLLKSKTTKGTSIVFYYLIDIGYVAGITAKIIKLTNGIQTPWYVWFFYILNFCMVLFGIIIYYRNKKYDKEREAENNSQPS